MGIQFPCTLAGKWVPSIKIAMFFNLDNFFPTSLNGNNYDSN